jgi:16S rRNA (uracil1498-N3)-methyltransferase
MALPFFYRETIEDTASFVLDEATSKHVIQVLRMQAGEQLQLTDGKGNLLTAEITDDNRKRCAVKKITLVQVSPPTRSIAIAISPVKNASRFEWFLEKATEIGITEIIPLLCERTEKQHFRPDRMNGVLVSAMLQSQQCRLPVLHEPRKFEELINHSTYQQKFIAHCIAEEKRNLVDLVNKNLSSQIVLIGPEGDFTKEEIDLAVQHHFIPVALGETRLRTETAGVAASVILKIAG